MSGIWVFRIPLVPGSLILSGSNFILFLGVAASVQMGRREADLLKWSSDDKCLVNASKLAKDLEQVVQW